MRLLIAAFLCVVTSVASAENQSHALAMFGAPKYNKSFTHFDYANPKAPKGGSLHLASQGGFDSLNPFIAKGQAADGIGYIYDSLTVSSGDEPFSQYALVAKTIHWPDDRSYVRYTLRPEARFHDGKKITADDVAFSFNLLMEKGSPMFKSQYANVAKVTVEGPHSVRFDFKDTSNQELILIIGQLPILPKHAINAETFDKTSLEKPLGSGPYKISKVDPGKRIRLLRVKDYWAKDLPVNKGRYNFDSIQYDYYRDTTVMLEALKVGAYDFRLERISKQWATGYKSNALREGVLKKQEIKHSNPQGMQAFILNTRNPLFADINVRKALNYAFDFEWTNQALFYGAYKRSDSYFSNSELAAPPLPTKAELELLTPLKQNLPESVFTSAYKNPTTKGDGNNRNNLRQAKRLLVKAGWQVKDGVLKNADGKPFKFEFLIYDASFERIINPYIQSLKKLGIQASIRKVEISQYIQQMRQFNFDVISATLPQSLSPGIEQMQYWHSSSANTKASRNFSGINNKAIDVLVKKVISADTRPKLLTATHALDRALLHNYYTVPQWHIGKHRIAYWDKFGKPKTAPKYDFVFSQSLNTWWQDDVKATKVKAFKAKH